MPAARRFLIKICGVTTAEDAALAAAAGADAIGINFWSGSKRFVGDDPAQVRRVLAAIPAGVLKVGVFVNQTAGTIEALMRDLGLDRAQLHGDERADHYQLLPRERLVRAVRIQDHGSFTSAEPWGASAGLFLYDGFVDGYGGGGVAAPWALIAAHVAAHPSARPFLLAGGLTPDNVAEAIRLTRPDGVDVASGVERAPGRKDPVRVAAFIRAARAAAARLSDP